MNNKIINNFTILIIYFAFFPTNAYAYLDPGTGSIIITAIIAFIATISTKISYFWEKIKRYFGSRNKERDIHKKNTKWNLITYVSLKMRQCFKWKIKKAL